jgi:hypothetical protein
VINYNCSYLQCHAKFPQSVGTFYHYLRQFLLTFQKPYQYFHEQVEKQHPYILHKFWDQTTCTVHQEIHQTGFEPGPHRQKANLLGPSMSVYQNFYLDFTKIK